MKQAHERQDDERHGLERQDLERQDHQWQDRQQAGVALAAAGDGPPFVVRLEGSEVLSLGGTDARSFLHGQLANEVNALPESGCGRSLLLNHKGHAMAETAVLRSVDALLCVVDDGKLAWVKDTLERHIVFDDVKVSQPTAVVLTMQGARSAEALHAAGFEAPAADRYVESAALGDAKLLVYPSRRSQAGGFDLVILADTAELTAALLARLARAGAVEVGPRALAVARVAAGLATAGSEGGVGVLPQESGLTSLLSYRKGCYLGQEIMARIEARGNLRRELATVELDGLPLVPTPAGEAGGTATSPAEQRAISAGGKAVGVLGTVARLPDGSVRALCVLRRDLDAGARLSVGGVQGRRLTMSAPIMPA